MHFQPDRSDWEYCKRNVGLILFCPFTGLRLSFLAMFPPLPCLTHIHTHTHTLMNTHTAPGDLGAYICVSEGSYQTFNR